VRAERLEVRGDVAFGKDVVIIGDVEVEAAPGEQRQIPDETELRG
jgi:UTP--glucose-1-phosphate uridylyltransferase